MVMCLNFPLQVHSENIDIACILSRQYNVTNELADKKIDFCKYIFNASCFVLSFFIKFPILFFS